MFNTNRTREGAWWSNHLEGAQVDGVDADIENKGKCGGDNVRSEEDDEGDPEGIILGGEVGLTVQVVEGDERAKDGYGDLHDNFQDGLYRLVDNCLREILHLKAEGIEAGAAERRAVDGDEDEAPVGDVLYRLLNAPEAAVDALEEQPEQQVGLDSLSHRVGKQGAQHSEKLEDCNNQSAEAHRSQVLEPHAAGARNQTFPPSPELGGGGVLNVPYGYGAGHGGPEGRLDCFKRPEHTQNLQCAETEPHAVGDVFTSHLRSRKA